MSRVEWMTFSQLRGDETRTWYRRSDILARLAQEGLPFAWHDARKILARLPQPRRRYGHYQYEQQHLDAVLQAAREEFA